MEPKRLMNEFIKSKIETKPVPFEFDKTNEYRNRFLLSSYSKLPSVCQYNTVIYSLTYFIDSLKSI